MITQAIVNQLTENLGRDAWAFLPELILCTGIVLLLLARLFRGLSRFHLGGLAQVVALVALVAAFLQWTGRGGLQSPNHFGGSLPIFTGLLVYDHFTVFLRMFLLFFAALMVWLSLITRIPDREDSADFYVLLLGATLGMCVMGSANHLLMVFLGVEMASLPSYALAGFLKGRRRSSEAALKYVVYGSGASGIMLYGISLLAGRFGTGLLPALGAANATLSSFDPALVLAVLFLVIGIAFKLAAVPFHFWCPDVFEGASAEVAGFLSVASKGAAMALLARVAFSLAGLDLNAVQHLAAGGGQDWMNVARYLIPCLAVLAAVTATFGNLAAYVQTNLKRLLAYSTIAHAGYMIMGLAPLTRDGGSAVLFYLVAYLFMNLGAFAVIAFLRNMTGSEDLSSFRGLVRRSPVMVITLSVFMLSLLGIPPLAGFAAKFQVFQALYDGSLLYDRGGHPGLGKVLFALLVIGGINTVISAVYYLKVLKVMILETPVEEVEGRPVPALRPPEGSVAYAVLLALVILVVGILWNPLAELAARGTDRFRRAPDTEPVAAAPAPALEVRP